MRSGYPYITDPKFSERNKYLECLSLADIGQNRHFIDFIARTVEQAIDANLRIKEKPKVLSLAEASRCCPYSQEYLSLLARKGAIGAFKQGRNWYITNEDLNRYVQSIEEKKERAKYSKPTKK